VAAIEEAVLAVAIEPTATGVIAALVDTAVDDAAVPTISCADIGMDRERDDVELEPATACSTSALSADKEELADVPIEEETARDNATAVELAADEPVATNGATVVLWTTEDDTETPITAMDTFATSAARVMNAICVVPMEAVATTGLLTNA
jgi:hypothetical protein